MKTNDKLELLSYLIFIRGKLQRLSIELLIEGQDTSKVDKAEKKLAKQIDTLRSSMMQRWHGDANEIMAELRTLNDRAQGKIREMRNAINKAEKVSEVVKILDDGLNLISRILV